MKKHTRNSAAFPTSGIEHSLSVFFCSATKRSLYFTGHQQHTAIHGLRSIRGQGEAKSPASRECIDDDESDLGLTGNRAPTLEQKKKIFVLFFLLSMGRSLFCLFILHLHLHA
jgi:hypothetical protein